MSVAWTVSHRAMSISMRSAGELCSLLIVIVWRSRLQPSAQSDYFFLKWTVQNQSNCSRFAHTYPIRETFMKHQSVEKWLCWWRMTLLSVRILLITDREAKIKDQPSSLVGGVPKCSCPVNYERDASGACTITNECANPSLNDCHLSAECIDQQVRRRRDQRSTINYFFCGFALC